MTYKLDCSGHLCPVPILMTEEKLSDLSHGDVLEVTFTDRGAKADLEAWCRATKNQFLSYREENFTGIATIKKAAHG